MCVAIPLKIEKVSGSEGLCSFDGAERLVRLDFIRDPKPGDYVLVHAGFAIERVDEAEALESIQLAQELEDALRS